MAPAVAPVVCTLRREVGLPWNSSSKRYIIGPTGSLKIYLNVFNSITCSSSVKESLILTALVLKSFKWNPDTRARYLYIDRWGRPPGFPGGGHVPPAFTTL